jgi:hypothetical protein
MRKVSRKGLVKKLDTVFSIYIRLRKANKQGIVTCYTCGKQDHYKKMQNGHFMSRKSYSTRWEELNCQVQCYSCNVMRYGEQYKYGLELQKEYGKDLPEQLLIQSKQIVKFSNIDLEDMINKYKELVDKRKKELSL